MSGVKRGALAAHSPALVVQSRSNAPGAVHKPGRPATYSTEAALFGRDGICLAAAFRQTRRRSRPQSSKIRQSHCVQFRKSTGNFATMQYILSESPTNTIIASVLCSECQSPTSLIRIMPAIDAPAQIRTFFCKSCHFVTAVKFEG